MSLYNPAYRARVYAPRTVDRNENTILTARDSGEEFKISTCHLENLTYNDTADPSDWYYVGTAEYTASYATAPDGTSTGVRIDNISDAAGERVNLAALPSVALPNRTYTFSAWYKGEGTDVGKTVQMQLKRNTGTGVYAPKTFTLTDEWVQHSVTLETLADTVGLGANLVIRATSGTPANACLVWGPQVVEGDTLRTFIHAASTETEVWPGYLQHLRGRRNSVDLLGKDTDTGRLDLTIFDVRKTAGGSNAERWITQFFGDVEGVVQLLGCKVYVEESVDGGSNWTSYFTGRIQQPQLQSRIKCVFSCRDMGEEMESVVLFGGLPHSSIDYAAMANFFPVGLPVTYGGREAVPLLQGVIGSWTAGKRKIELKKDYDGYRSEHLVATDSMTNIQRHIFFTRWIGNSNTRIGVEFLDGAKAGLTGSYQLDQASVRWADISTLSTVGFREINSIDPDYLPIESASIGTRIEFKIFPYQNSATDAAETAKTEEKEKEKKPPFVIGDVNPATIAADICEGYFGFLYTPIVALPSGAAYGDPTQKIPYNSASFASLWETFEDEGITMRWIIEEPMKAQDWFVDEFGIPLNIAHYFNADGELTLIDMTRPATASITGTITNSDLILNSTPKQTVDKSKAITNWKWTIKSELQWTKEMLVQKFRNDDSSDPIPVSPTLVESFDQWDRAFYPRLLDIGDKTQKIEANGLRAWVETDEDIDTLEEVKAIIQRRVIEELGPIYGYGPVTYELDCARTSNTDDCVEGSYRILDIDELIDPVTNQRGGQRVAICYERYNDGPKVNLKFLDLGPGTTAFPPGGMGNIAKSTNDSYHKVWFQNVYPNKAGDRISFYTAATSQSIGTRPASDSSLWTLGRTAYLFNTGSWYVQDLPSGTRIWGRLRTEMAVSGNVAPSEWLYPDNDYVNLDTLPQPGTITTSDITGGTTEITWTNPAGAENGKVEILLDQATAGSAVFENIDILPPKSDTFTIYGMITSSVYTVAVRYVDANGEGGVGPMRTKQFTTSGSYATAPRPVDIIPI